MEENFLQGDEERLLGLPVARTQRFSSFSTHFDPFWPILAAIYGCRMPFEAFSLLRKPLFS